MIIFLYGSDTYRVRQRIEELKEKFIGKIDKLGLNIVNLEGEKLKMEEFRRAVCAAGFLVSRRMIIIENLIGKNKKSEIQKEILDYLKNLKDGQEENIIVFVEKMDGQSRSDSDKKVKSNALFGFLKKEKYAQEFKPLNSAQLNAWVNKEIKNRGGQIEPMAAAFLAGFVGGDLWRMSGEIDKLIAYAAGRKIKKEDIDSLVKSKIDDNIFNLVDAIGNKNKKSAFKLLKDQLEAGTPWPYLLSMLVRQFRILLQIKDATENGGERGSLAVKLGLHPFVVRKAGEQAGKYKLSELKNIYRRMLEIDVQMKTTQINPETLFDLLIANT